MKLAGNTVLITGGATGIGFALARAFAQAGSKVLICGRRAERLRQAQREQPGLEARVCDLGSADDCQALAAWVTATFPELNVLVNNGGIQRDLDLTGGAAGYLAGPSEIRINLEAPVLLSALLIPHLANRPGAAIVNVTSGLGFAPMARMPVYSATKAGLHAFTLALRHQVAKLGISVFEIVPPAVDTELNAEGRAARGGFTAGLSPEEFVTAVMRDLEAGRAEIGYGMTLGLLHASRAELDEAFRRMNGRS